jgi:hypothetical protein
MKVYSKRSFSPKLLFTCIYLFYCAILRESRPNSVPGSGVATDHLIEIWSSRPATPSLRLHISSRLLGLTRLSGSYVVWQLLQWPLQWEFIVSRHISEEDYKIFSAQWSFSPYFSIVCTGFAALGGHVKGFKLHNFDISTSFEGISSNGYNIGIALLNAIFSF